MSTHVIDSTARAAAPRLVRRALVVAYSFPPVGGAGVQRMLKLVKYLPRWGVEPIVLTVDNPSVPVRDESLLGDVPPGTEILRARTLEPGYGVKKAAWSAKAARPSMKARITGKLTGLAKEVLVPDAQVLWQPAAARAMWRALRRERSVDLVLISGPPFSQFLLAPLARLASRAAVVLDYRDEWSTYRTTYEMMGGALSRLAGDPLERALLERAHAVTTATEAFRANLLDRFDGVNPERVFAIPNGYDEEDFRGIVSEPRSDKLVLAYAGTVFKLTSMHGLMGAVRRLWRDDPARAAKLEVRFMGRVVDTEQSAFRGMEACGVEQLGYLDHTRVLEELSSATMTLCVLDDVPGAERIFPAKIFELMVLGRPVLTLAPEGALATLVREHAVGDVLPPRNEAQIARYLADRIDEFSRGGPEAVRHPKPRDIERYSRHALAGQFVDVFERAAGWARA